MLLRRRLEPKPSHALFFPDRKGEAALLMDSKVVWTWSVSDFKHIDLRDFDLAIGFGDTSMNPPAKTADGLPCSVTAIFWLRPQKELEALSKVTSGFPANQNLNDVCGSEHFKTLLRGELRATVKSSVGSFNFAQLLSDGTIGSKIDEHVKSAANKVADKHGFELIECGVSTNALGPAESAFSEESRRAWDEFQRRRAEAKLDDLRRKNEQTLAEGKLKVKLEVDAANMRVQTELDQADRDVELEKAKKNRDREIERLTTDYKSFQFDQQKARDKVQRDLDELNDSVQLRSIQFEQNRKNVEDAGVAERERRRAEAAHLNQVAIESHDRELAELRRQEEKLRRDEETVNASHRIQVARLKAELAEIEKNAALTNAGLTETMGLAEAKVIRETELAKGSLELALQELLLKHLPDVLSKSVAPAERMAEVRYFHLGGLENSGNTLNPIIVNAISHLPLVADVLEFIKSWKQARSRSESTSERSVASSDERSGPSETLSPGASSGSPPSSSSSTTAS